MSKIFKSARKSIILLIIFFPISFTFFYFKILKKHPIRFIIFHGIFFALIALYLKFWIINRLPSIDKMTEYKPILSTKFYDRNNEIIFELGNEKREFISIDKIPKQLINAFISAEDKTFYTNSGIDFISLGKIAIIDLYKLANGERLMGASTITQQVVRNILLNKDRTITRKIREFILSYQVSKTLSKDKIMEIYLNHIYLGMQAYGVVAASEIYFNKKISDLTISEMAVLASLPKAPSNINPFKNKTRTIARRNWILNRMLEEKYIKNSEYQDFIKDDIIVSENNKKNDFEGFYAPVFFAKDNIIKSDLGISEENLQKNGYQIKTTIDKNLQIISQKALNKGLIEYSKKHGFEGPIMQFDPILIDGEKWKKILSTIKEPEEIGDFEIAIVLSVAKNEIKIGKLDGSTGRILLEDILWARKKISETELGQEIKKCSDVLSIGDVIFTSKKILDLAYNDIFILEQIPKINGGLIAMNPKTGEILSMVGGYLDNPGGFNRAVQAFRQVGSAIKPFVYVIGLENGLMPTDTFMDASISMNLGNGVMWNPENHTKMTNGPVTLRSGLERSLNTVTIRIADRIGIGKIKKALMDFGINKNPEANLSIAIGSIESSLLSVANGYSAFVNKGILPNPYIISNIKPNSIEFNALKLQDFNFTPIPIIKKEEEIIQELPIKENLDNSSIEKIEEINPRQIISSQSAYQMLSLLEGAVRNGTSHSLNELEIPIAAKTGTSQGGGSLWTVAITSELVIGVYIGYDNNINTNNYGGQFALPIIKDVLSQIKEKYFFKSFEVPSGIKYIKINKQNGKRTNKDTNDKNVIYEVLKNDDKLPEFENDLEKQGEIFFNIDDI